MTKNLSSAIICASLVFSCFFSCKKEEAEDKIKPAISIAEPALNDTISIASEDSIHIEFSASDNDELHEVKVDITDEGGTNVFSRSADVDAKTYSFHEHFHPAAITGISMFTLKVEASDHHSNSESKTLTFYLKP
jgi:hypothetical protein